MKAFDRHCFAVLTLCALAAAAGAEPPPPQRDEDAVTKLTAISPGRFRIHDTAHFTIVYDTPFDALRPLTARLEGTYDAVLRFCNVMKLPPRPLPTRLPILLFDRFDDFAAYAAKAGLSASTAAGFYDQSTNVAAFAHVVNSPAMAPVRDEIASLSRRVETLTNRTGDAPKATERRDELLNRLNALRLQQDAFVEQFNRLVLQHEAAHQIFFNIGVHPRGADIPAWVVEGLACQFEVPQSDLGGELRRVNSMRLSDFRDALHVPADLRDESKADWRTAFQTGPLIPLGEFIALEALPAGTAGEAAARYAEAWSLVYFLVRERRDAFAAYLGRLADRPSGAVFSESEEQACFEADFGPLDDAFARDYIRFILRLRHDPKGQ